MVSVSERQSIESPSSPTVDYSTPPPPSYDEVDGVFVYETHSGSTDSMGYFLGEVSGLLYRVRGFLILFIANRSDSFSLCCVLLLQVMFPYQAVSEVELSLSLGDYVVVRKVCSLLYPIL